MAKFYRSLMDICWAFGLLCTVIGVILHYSPYLISRFDTQPRGALIFAAVLFLSAIATRAVGRTGIEPGR